MPRIPKFTHAQILEVAIKLIDSEGLAKLSMRRLGAELGVEAMSLYNYFSNKGELLDGVHGAILGQLELHSIEGSWAEQIETISIAFYELLLRHPNAIPIYASRPAISTESLKYIEYGLQIFRSAGFDEVQSLYAYQSTYNFILGHVSWYHSNQMESYATTNLASFPFLTRSLEKSRDRGVKEEFLFGLKSLLEGFKAQGK